MYNVYQGLGNVLSPITKYTKMNKLTSVQIWIEFNVANVKFVKWCKTNHVKMTTISDVYYQIETRFNDTDYQCYLIGDLKCDFNIG